MKQTKVRALSKSKILAYRQCPKRLWLEIHRPALREDSAATQASFSAGHEIGDIARKLYDPKGTGHLITLENGDFDAVFASTTEALASSQPVFEAALTGGGLLAFADVMLPVRKNGRTGWRMVEVKSSTRVKEYQRDDVAVQAFIAKEARVPILSVALAHVDSRWVYPGGGQYKGLLVEEDLTAEAFDRADEVRSWAAEAKDVVRMGDEPVVRTGNQCGQPYECGFRGYCEGQEPKIEYPLAWIPRIQTAALKALRDEEGVNDMRDVPLDLLNEPQRRVRDCTLSSEVYFDAAGAAADLAPYKLPVYFLDFETVSFAVPIWKGTRPWQQIPFQFSVHRLLRSGRLEHQGFLDLDGDDPSRACAEALVAACGERGAIFAYSAGFERRCIRELADRFPRLRRQLLAISDRIIDLLITARKFYYHPAQQGSWSIKAVLPAVVPALRYDALNGVQDGGMAMAAYREAISAETSQERRAEIERQLHEYCRLDTYAMVRLWQVFAGRSDRVV